MKTQLGKDFLIDFLNNTSSTEHIGCSDHLDHLKSAVLTELVSEERESVEAFDFGQVEVNMTQSIRLDEDSIPVLKYELLFVDLKFKINIEARHAYHWYYYLEGYSNID